MASRALLGGKADERLFAMTFVVPVILFPLSTAIVTCLIWGLSVSTLLSYFNAELRTLNI